MSSEFRIDPSIKSNSFIHKERKQSDSTIDSSVFTISFFMRRIFHLDVANCDIKMKTKKHEICDLINKSIKLGS